MQDHTQRSPSDHPSVPPAFSSPRRTEVQCSVSHSEYLLSAAGRGIACVCVPSAHTAPQLSLSHCSGSFILDLASEAQWPQMTTPPELQQVSLLAPLALWEWDGYWAWWSPQVTLGCTVECLDNMLHLLDPTGSILDFNF